MKVRYAPEAILDMESIKNYIADTLCNPQAAEKTIVAIAKSCSQLENNPLLGIELSKRTNSTLNGRYIISGKYAIIYQVADEVSVLRIIDTRTGLMQLLFH